MYHTTLANPAASAVDGTASAASTSRQHGTSSASLSSAAVQDAAVNEGCPWLSVSRLARDTMQRSWIQALFFLAYERLINLWNRTIRVYVFGGCFHMIGRCRCWRGREKQRRARTRKGKEGWEKQERGSTDLSTQDPRHHKSKFPRQPALRPTDLGVRVRCVAPAISRAPMPPCGPPVSLPRSAALPR